jgi:glycosyltransferase involved in cell wall biosynthesis
MDAPDMTVIPCCVDFSHFPLPDAEGKRLSRQRLGIAPEARVLVYLGSVGTWYMLDEMLDFFLIYLAEHPEARFLVITPDEPKQIRAAAAARGVSGSNLAIVSASRQEVPSLIAAADLGIFFIKPAFSKKASSPTKMGELLASGVPIVTNAGVGDVEEIVAETRCGATVAGFDVHSYATAIRQVEAIGADASEIRLRAMPWFDLETGVERYDSIYRSLTP